jgi:hypothetical protein
MDWCCAHRQTLRAPSRIQSAGDHWSERVTPSTFYLRRHSHPCHIHGSSSVQQVVSRIGMEAPRNLRLNLRLNSGQHLPLLQCWCGKVQAVLLLNQASTADEFCPAAHVCQRAVHVLFSPGVRCWSSVCASTLQRGMPGTPKLSVWAKFESQNLRRGGLACTQHLLPCTA